MLGVNLDLLEEHPVLSTAKPSPQPPLLHLYVGSRNQTHAIRLPWQIPHPLTVSSAFSMTCYDCVLSTEQCCGPFLGIRINKFEYQVLHLSCHYLEITEKENPAMPMNWLLEQEGTGVGKGMAPWAGSLAVQIREPEFESPGPT